tara:strand:- start:1094 stop:1501 length:408 start_codon:yes stop_codon:yes gene_type:complete
MTYSFVHTDAGRITSRRPRQDRDCTVRALAVVCNLGYDAAYDLLKNRGRKSHNGAFFPNRAADDEAAGHIFKWRAFPAVKGQRRMSPPQFCSEYPTGRFIIKTAKHVTAVIDGTVYDIQRIRDNRCVYGCWLVSH